MDRGLSVTPTNTPDLTRASAPLGRSRASHRLGDRTLHAIVVISALLVLALIVGIFVELLVDSRLALSTFGASFFYSDEWSPAFNEFGALPSIYGTLMSTAIAMVIAFPLSLVIALFLVELAPARFSAIVGGAIELLAAIPSIIYGMWGLFVLAPWLAEHVQPAIKEYTFGLPLFSGPPMGIGLFTAGLVLALMVLPFMTAITRDIFRMTPAHIRESSYGIGATTWETARQVLIPYGFRGILGGAFLGLGRALGETMAVTFVIGNSHNISLSVFKPATTISATLANEFTEASEPLYLSSLIALGLALMIVTLVVQIAAQLWLRRMHRKAEGKA
jgi:phosphate transport system permease protein